MEKPVFVHERQTLKYLIHNVSNVRFGEQPIATLHQLVEVPFHVLKHKEQFVILSDDL
jgi:hypothetical protein